MLTGGSFPVGRMGCDTPFVPMSRSDKTTVAVVLQPTEKRCTPTASRQRPHESAEQISFVIFDLVQSQQFTKLILERLFLVMLPLVLYILHDLIDVRFTNRKNAEPILPCEVFHRLKFVMYPMRRAAFQKLSDVARRDRRARARQCMNMIIDPADLDRDHPVLSRYAADVRPNAFLDIRANEIKSVLGAKNNVVITIGICVCHGFMRSLTRRGHIIMHPFRGLKHHGYFRVSLRDK